VKTGAIRLGALAARNHSVSNSILVEQYRGAVLTENELPDEQLSETLGSFNLHHPHVLDNRKHLVRQT
jgi:hypothetical protein